MQTSVEAARRGLDRMLRQRRVGKAYGMAEEIAALLPATPRVADIGCGDGRIAQQLGVLTGGVVVGVDVRPTTLAAIPYHPFDGRHLPFADAHFDAALLCYVLHHAQDQLGLLQDVARILQPGGRVVVYEDMPGTLFDRLLCRRHDRAWRARTGPCTFHLPDGWVMLFERAGFRLVVRRPLWRFRDPTHPVGRSLFLFERSLPRERRQVP